MIIQFLLPGLAVFVKSQWDLGGNQNSVWSDQDVTLECVKLRQDVVVNRHRICGGNSKACGIEDEEHVKRLLSTTR